MGAIAGAKQGLALAIKQGNVDNTRRFNALLASGPPSENQYDRFYAALVEELRSSGLDVVLQRGDSSDGDAADRMNRRWIVYLNTVTIGYFATSVTSPFHLRVVTALVPFDSEQHRSYAPIAVQFVDDDPTYAFGFSETLFSEPQRSTAGLRIGVERAARFAAKQLIAQ